MFSSWDLVRPRFWYPMSSLEQSMMDLEQMSDAIMRPRFPFGMQRQPLAPHNYVDDGSDSDDVNDFFVDLPVVARKYKPSALQLEIVPEVELADEDEQITDINCENGAKSDTDTSTDMDVDDEGDHKQQSTTQDKTKTAAKTATKTGGKLKTNNKHRNRKNKKSNKQLSQHSYKVAPSSETKVSTGPDADCRTFTSYSFSNSSVVDDKGRRVTTTRRRYEDSTGRLKAVHEREIDGKKLRTTWSRQDKEDEGRHESICSSGSPEEFETLWQQTPFGEAQKKKVKGQLQSEADVEKEVASTATALEDSNMDHTPAKQDKRRVEKEK